MQVDSAPSPQGFLSSAKQRSPSQAVTAQLDQISTAWNKKSAILPLFVSRARHRPKLTD